MTSSTPTKPYVADPQLMAAITGRPASQCFVHPMHVAATLTLGQQVTVFAPDTWLDGRTGTVVKLPVGDYLLRDGAVTVEIDGDSQLGVNPIRSMDARRVAPLSTCDICVHGCECDGAAGMTDCGHYACWGRADGQTAPRCPGADVQRARSAALRFAMRHILG